MVSLSCQILGISTFFLFGIRTKLRPFMDWQLKHSPGIGRHRFKSLACIWLSRILAKCPNHPTLGYSGVSGAHLLSTWEPSFDLSAFTNKKTTSSTQEQWIPAEREPAGSGGWDCRVEWHCCIWDRSAAAFSSDVIGLGHWPRKQLARTDWLKPIRILPKLRTSAVVPARMQHASF